MPSRAPDTRQRRLVEDPGLRLGLTGIYLNSRVAKVEGIVEPGAEATGAQGRAEAKSSAA